MDLILGLQKLTLLDYPGQTACTLFTGGCNFRCPYCQNSSLVLTPEEVEPYSWDEIIGFLNRRKGLLDGVCITGGEPLLHPQIDSLIRTIHSMGFMVKLDTNGSYPDHLKDLVRSGCVDYVAMDIKNSPQNYGRTIGIPEYDLSAVQESVRYLLSAPVEYEFRTTVVREYHQPADFVAISLWIKGARRYFLQAFVDSGDLISPGLHGYDRTEMENFAALVHPLVPSVQLRGI